MAVISITGSGGRVPFAASAVDDAGVSVAAAAPTSVGVITERGGVGVTVPPPSTAVGNCVPSANAVKFGDGVAVGKDVGTGLTRTKAAAIQPSRPSSMRILNHFPSGLVAKTCTPVPGLRATIALAPTLGPSRTFTVSSEATMPVTGGVALAVGVSDGVGEMGVSEGVSVKVGSGVLEGTGVAVKRGVKVTSGARVSVGTPALCSPGVAVLQAAINNKTNKAAIKA